VTCDDAVLNENIGARLNPAGQVSNSLGGTTSSQVRGLAGSISGLKSGYNSDPFHAALWYKPAAQRVCRCLPAAKKQSLLLE